MAGAAGTVNHGRVGDTLGRLILIILTVAINAGHLSDFPIISTVSAALLLGYACYFRRGSLLLCGILFLLLSIDDIGRRIPVFSEVPVIWILTVIVFSVLAVSPFKGCRSWSIWFKYGKLDGFTIAAVAGVSLVSAAALIAWAGWSDNLGIAVKMAQGVRHYPKPLTLMVLIPCFAALNALMEEIVFRGVLQTALSEFFHSPHLIIAMQASAFAAFHFAIGFPNGWSGYGMTLLYGSALGYLKQWTDGLFAPWLCHLMADLTIFYYVVNLTLQHIV